MCRQVLQVVMLFYIPKIGYMLRYLDSINISCFLNVIELADMYYCVLAGEG